MHIYEHTGLHAPNQIIIGISIAVMRSQFWAKIHHLVKHALLHSLGHPHIHSVTHTSTQSPTHSLNHLHIHIHTVSYPHLQPVAHSSIHQLSRHYHTYQYWPCSRIEGRAQDDKTTSNMKRVLWDSSKWAKHSVCVCTDTKDWSVLYPNQLIKTKRCQIILQMNSEI